MTLKEAQILLNISHDTLNRWMKEGIVKRWKVGGVVRIPISELERLVAQHTAPSPPALTNTQAREADRLHTITD